MDPNPSNSADPSSETPTTPSETPVTPSTFGSSPAPEAPVTPEVAPVAQPAVEPTPQVVPIANPAASVVTPTGDNPGHTLGVVGLILSIIGMHLIGLIVGIIGLNKSKKAGHKNGLALAAIIIGAIGLVVGIIVGITLIGVFTQLAATCADLGSGTHYVDGVTYTCS